MTSVITAVSKECFVDHRFDCNNICDFEIENSKNIFIAIEWRIKTNVPSQRNEPRRSEASESALLWSDFKHVAAFPARYETMAF